jgi:hypothetical protein
MTKQSINVGQLRKLLADLPDETDVLVFYVYDQLSLPQTLVLSDVIEDEGIIKLMVEP